MQSVYPHHQNSKNQIDEPQIDLHLQNGEDDEEVSNDENYPAVDQ